MASSRHIITTTPIVNRVPFPLGLSAGADVAARRQQLVPLEYAKARAAAPSDAAGETLLRFGPPDQGTLWLLQSVLVHCENTPGSTASVYVGDQPINFNLEAGTLTGDLDVAQGDPPVYVPGGQEVLVEWVGAGVGNVCTAKLQYIVARLS